MATLNTTTVTELDYAIQELWEKKVREDKARVAFWDKFEGAEGSGMPISKRNDFSKEPGDVMHIQVMSELEGAGVTGASSLETNEEKLALAQFDLTTDWLRHAVAWDKKANKRANFDCMMAANPRLSRWAARYTDAELFKEILDNTTNTIYGGTATSSATIAASSVFGVPELDKISLALRRQGAEPISIERKGKYEMPVYGVVISEMDLYNLIQDDDFTDTLATAGIRGETNPLFTMAFGMFHGMLIYTHNGIGGFQGSPLRPEAAIYGASNTAGAATITVGASTAKNYTKFFADAGTISIVRSDTGAREFVTYTSKTNNTFVCGASRGQTYGGITSVAANYATLAGSLITQNNHESIQIGFGAEVAARSWTQPFKMVTQIRDYEFEHGVGIEGCFGQAVIENFDGDTPNSVLCKCYGLNPNKAI